MAYFFNGNNQGMVNSLTWGDNVTFTNNTMYYLFGGCRNYNSPVDIPSYITNAGSLIYADNYNHPINIDPYGNLIDMQYLVASNDFNCDLNIPVNAKKWRYCVNVYGYNNKFYNANIELYAKCLDEYNNNVPDGYYQYAFAYMSGFNGNVHFHQMPTDMRMMFYSCYNFNRNINIPQGVNQNCYDMFYYCGNLNQNIRLPDDSHSEYAFAYCSNLDKNIRVPRNSSIYSLFYNCTNLDKPIYIPAFPSNGPQGSGDNIYYDASQGGYIFSGCTNLNSAVTFSNSITNLYGTFYNCKSLDRAIALPSGLKDMHSTFSDCSNLRTGQSIPGGVVRMTSTFSSCFNFNVNQGIPDGVIHMGGTFSSCSNLNQNIKMPSSGKYFYSTFGGCTNFDQDIQFPSGTLDLSSCFSRTNMTHNIQIPTGTEKTSGMFGSCPYFNQNISIPSTVKDMSSMFGGCNNFNQNIYIPLGVEYMAGAFASCPNFKQHVTIPSSVKIFNSAFTGTKVTDVDIHSSYITNMFNGNGFISLVNAIDVSGHTAFEYNCHGALPRYFDSYTFSDPVATITFNRSAVVNTVYYNNNMYNYNNRYLYANNYLYNCWNGYEGYNCFWYNTFGGGVPLRIFNPNSPYYNHGDLYIYAYDYYDGGISAENMRVWRECFYCDYPNGYWNDGEFYYNLYWIQVRFV